VARTGRGQDAQDGGRRGARCPRGLAVSDALTSTTTHDLCEAITDPIPGQGWYDGANGEIGDIRAWQTKTIGDHAVQLE
jgi:hypothetical protein